ncbi:ribosome recycling factor [Candidatus Falkowbacteria bacterium]|nr:ribosome recycling factor [Candidatus Falkowbacteria bacterium]
MAKSNRFIDKSKKEFDKAIEHFKTELSGLRTGRAQSTIVENILVEAYGAQTPLKQLAAISIPEPKTISIQPWDKNIIKDIERAFSYSNLGLSIVNAGDKLVAKLPPMTEENRKELVKVIGQKLEAAKISLRRVRDMVREEILNSEKDKAITQDDKFEFLADLDNYIAEHNQKIAEMAKEKEEEVMIV